MLWYDRPMLVRLLFIPPITWVANLGCLIRRHQVNHLWLSVEAKSMRD